MSTNPNAISMSHISNTPVPRTNRHDPNFEKSFEQISNELYFRKHGHKNQRIIFFTFKRN